MRRFSPFLLLGLAAPILLLLLVALPCPATAAKNGPPPAPDAPCIVPSTTYTNGSAEMTLCIQGHKVWRERRNNGRTAQVSVTLNNTGDSMVCDLRVEVEGMEKALHWWPDWLNSTRYPYFSLAPGQTVSVGAVIPQEQGFPGVSITSMRDCDGEDAPASFYDSPAKQQQQQQQAIPNPQPLFKAAAAAGGAEKPKPAAPKASAAKPAAAPKADASSEGEGEAAAEAGGGEAEEPEASAAEDEDDDIPASTLKKPDCSTKTGAGGLKARWCVEKAPYVWVEPRRHRRIVRVRAEITNLQTNVSLCGIKVELEKNKSAINTWPEWWPESDEDDPLDPGNSFVVGANIYYKKGAPKLHLLAFRACVDTGAVPEEPETPPEAPPAPVTNPTAPAAAGAGGQQQQQAWNAGGNTNNDNSNNNWQQPQPAQQPQQNNWGNGGGDNNWQQQQQQQQGGGGGGGGGANNNWGQQPQQQNSWGGDNGGGNNNNNNWQH